VRLDVVTVDDVQDCLAGLAVFLARQLKREKDVFETDDSNSRVQMLHKIPALITHQPPKKPPDCHFLQLIVTRNGCLRTKLLVDIFSKKPVSASVWPARQKFALSAPSSRRCCQSKIARFESQSNSHLHSKFHTRSTGVFARALLHQLERGSAIVNDDHRLSQYRDGTQWAVAIFELQPVDVLLRALRW
jgi:hypothetical protein